MDMFGSLTLFPVLSITCGFLSFDDVLFLLTIYTGLFAKKSALHEGS